MPIEGDVPVTRFELLETQIGGEHRIHLIPSEVADTHGSYSFGRGMEFWSEEDSRDVVIYHDQRTAHLGGSKTGLELTPSDLPSPLRFFSRGLSRDAKTWATAFFSMPDMASTIWPQPVQTLSPLPDHADWKGTRETVALPDLLANGKPLTITRDIYFSSGHSQLPVQVDYRFAGDLKTRWRLEWERSSAPSETADVIRGHRLARLRVETFAMQTVMAIITFEPVQVESMAGAPGLTPEIPNGYSVIDLDAPPEVQAAAMATAARAQSWFSLRILITGAVAAMALLVAFLYLWRRRASRAAG